MNNSELKEKTLTEFDITTDSISESSKNVQPTSRLKFNSVVLALALGSMTLTGCSDTKSCSDVDTSSYADGNGSARYDLGADQDSYDDGGDTDTSSSGDSVGNGDRCSDYD